MLELYEQNHAVQASQGGGSEIEGGSTSNVTATRLLPPPKPVNEDTASASGRPRPTDDVDQHHHPVKNSSGEVQSGGISDAMKRIDKDKVKAALEKRKQSRGSSLPRGTVDEDDLIEQELESGVELAAREQRNGEVGVEESSAAEEGELSSIDCLEPHHRPKRQHHGESGHILSSPGRDEVEREPKRARHEALV